MKITWLLIQVLFFGCLVYCRHVQLTVGALFHEDSYESEMAFKYAIARHNMYSNVIKFRTNIQKISTTDTFATSKLVCNMTASDDGLVALFGPPSLKVGAMAQSVCKNLEIPYILTTWNPQILYSHQTVLNFYPDHDLLAQGFATIVRHMDWSSYVILYETSEGLNRLQEILKIVNVNNEPVLVRQLGSGSDHRPLLKEVKNSTIHQIILDCDLNNIIDILHQAKEVNILDYFYSFLITNLDAHTLDFRVLNTNANITVMRIIDPDNPILHNAVLDWQQGELNDHRYISFEANKVKTEAALMHDAVNFFTSVLSELHISENIETEPLSCDEYDHKKWVNGFRIATYMKVRNMMNSITGAIKLNELGRRIDFTLQLVEIINGKEEKTATWRPIYPGELNFTRSASEQMQQIVENLQKTTVIVSSRLGAPYLQEVKPKEGEVLEGNDRYEGYSKDLIYHISKELNFTFLIRLADDGNYGNYDEDKKAWNGLIKDLLDRRAHLAICDLTITHQRRSVVDFSLPFMNLGISILYSKAVQQESGKFAFMDPFGLDIWVCTATLYLGVSVLLYFIARMAPGDWENPHPCEQSPTELENIWNLNNCLWITIGSIMTQGCDILPKGISTRMGVSMWWFFSLIMTSSYTANLAAFLTMDRMAPTIDSAEALVKQTKIKYGLVEHASTEAFFRESNFSTYARMWVNMRGARPSVFEKNNADGVKRVLTTKNQLYAFLMESSSLEYEVQKNCNLKQIGTRLDSKGYGIAMPMNSPYRSAINKAVLELQEKGTMTKLKTKWWKEKVPIEVPCEEQPESTGNELKLASVGGVFFLLFMGILGALLLACIEFLWNVREVSISEHIGYWEALKVEFQFAIKVWVTQKQVKPDLSESTSSSSGSRGVSETKSVTTKTLKNAASFLRLDILELPNRNGQ